MFHWLLLAFVTDLQEKQTYLKTIKRIKVQTGVTIYAYVFGPNTNSSIQQFKIDATETKELEILHVETGTQKYNKYLKTLKNIISDLFIKINGVIYYGHSGGIILGLWAGTKTFATVTDFVQTVLIPLQPTIVIFDSCYMGTISALYELSAVNSLEFTMASPYYHPGFSVLQTKAFGQIGTNKPLLQSLQDISCEFQQKKSPRYRCFLLFDMKKIPKLIRNVRLAIKHKKLVFNKESCVNKLEDLYDLHTSAQYMPLQSQIQEVTAHSCNLDKCYKIRGVTIDIALPALHLKVYKKMRWFKLMQDLMYV